RGRPGDPAASAAHHRSADEEDDGGDGQGRSRRDRGHGEDAPRQGRRVPAGTLMGVAVDAPVERVAVSAYEIPTDELESDGTLEWGSTTIVVVEVAAGGQTGLGYTYGPRAVATLVDEKLTPLLTGSDPVILTGSDPVKAWGEMG